MSNTYSVKNDPWAWSRLTWMRDNQPDRLVELTKKPAKLLEVIDQAVQSARKAHYEAQQSGLQPHEAEEIGLSVLCPAEDDGPSDTLNLPLSEKQWKQAQEAFKSAPEEI